MCLYPKLIKNKKYTPNKKNGGIIPAYTDKRVLAVPVGCGKCIECTKQRARGWQTRLKEDIRHHKNGIFVTLTFSPEEYTKLNKEINQEQLEYDIDNQICKLAIKRFLGRWKKHHKGKSIRHWLVTELGHQGTEHVHLHGILYATEEQKKEITKLWKYGFVWMGYENKANYVNEKTINYITKYVSKIDFKHKEYKPIILCSPGIGKGYIDRLDHLGNKYKKNNTNETYTDRQGIKTALPIYWRNKIYTDEEREKLWIEKLDKEIRYICGEKIDISKGMKEYYKLLEYHRSRNKTLGYGDNQKNWQKIEYENQIRKITRRKKIIEINEEELKSERKRKIETIKETKYEELQYVFDEITDWCPF